MNIPNLPTDSLYKFLAIAGLSLIVISLYLGYNLEMTHNAEAIKFNGDIAIFNKERDDLNSDLEFIKRKLKKLCAVCKCNCFDKNGDIQILPNFKGSGSSELNEQRHEVDSLLINYYDKQNQLVTKGLQIDTQKELIENSAKYRDTFMNIFMTLLGAGTVMTLIGFGLWYKKIQIYQDIILKSEASKFADKPDVGTEKQMD